MQLSYVVLYVSDLQKSFEFYNGLEFDLTAEQHGNSPLHYSFSINELIIELYPASTNRVSRCRLGIALSHSSLLWPSLETQQNKIIKDPDSNILNFQANSG